MKFHICKQDSNLKLDELLNLVNEEKLESDFMFTDDKLTFDKIKKILENESIEVYVLEVEGKYIGFSTVIIKKKIEEIKNVAKIQSIGISPDFRGKGYGTKLLQFILDELGKKGITTVYLEVISGNQTAISMYKNCGFKNTGEIESFYHKNGTSYSLLTFTSHLS